VRDDKQGLRTVELNELLAFYNLRNMAQYVYIGKVYNVTGQRKCNERNIVCKIVICTVIYSSILLKISEIFLCWRNTMLRSYIYVMYPFLNVCLDWSDGMIVELYCGAWDAIWKDSILDLRWTKWYKDRIFSDFLGFPLPFFFAIMLFTNLSPPTNFFYGTAHHQSLGVQLRLRLESRNCLDSKLRNII
jgi:hypothetical protein